MNSSENKAEAVEVQSFDEKSPTFNSNRNSIFYVSKKDLSQFSQPFEEDFAIATGPVVHRQKEQKRCVLAFFVLPALSVFYWILLVPYRISYDISSRKYYKIIGSPLRKVICFILGVLNLLYYIGQLKLLIRNSNGGAIGIIYEITYMIFIMFTMSTLYVIWFKMDGIVKLFIEIDQLQAQFISNGMNFQKSNMIHFMTWAAYGLHAYLIISYPIFIVGNDRIFMPLLENGLTLKGLNEVAKETAKEAFLSTCPLMGIDPSNGIFNTLPQWLIILVAVFFETIETLSGCIWILSNLVILMWGFVFVKLLHSFLLKCKANRYLAGKVLEDIRDFNRITSIFDNFNETLGVLTFFAVIAAILYISVTAGQMLLSTSQGSFITKVVYVSSFSPFLMVLVLASQANRMANEFPSLLKTFYNCNDGSDTWAHTKDKKLEVLQGLAIVHHDVLSNSIGFRGLEFFTISYSFIGTVISVIASYAVVALQLNPPTSPTH